MNYYYYVVKYWVNENKSDSGAMMSLQENEKEFDQLEAIIDSARNIKNKYGNVRGIVITFWSQISKDQFDALMRPDKEIDE